MIKKITIKEPIWSTQSVGIKTAGLMDDDQVEVTISYKDKHGNFVFPGTFLMDVSKVRECPVTPVKYGIRVHVVPISVLQEHRKDDIMT